MSNNKPLVNMVTDEQVTGQAKELFEQIKGATGSVPKWMRVMANNEDILVGFFTMFKAIMDDAPVNKLLKWKIAYQISEINKCEFCVSVAKMQLQTFGLSDEEIRNIEKAMNEEELIAMEYAKAATEHSYNIDKEVFAKMKEKFTDEQIVEITSVVGLFSFVNRFNDALGVLPEVK